MVFEMAKLVQPVNFSKLTAEGFEFQIDTSHAAPNDPPSENEDDEQDLFDEDEYDNASSFDEVSQKMENLLSDGKIKKRTLREGNGEKPGRYATVKIHYNAYVEFDAKPFDSTYLNRHPKRFVVDDGRVIPGLDFAVQSMRVQEKSQFLIHPEYAFGKNDLLGRVPANSTLLFEVELLEIASSGETVAFELLPEEKQVVFPEVYKYCTALCEKAKKLFVRQEYKKAIKEYNTAVGRLNKVSIVGKGEVEQHRDLLLRIYANLLVCCARSEQYKKGCDYAQRFYRITNNGDLVGIPTKVYYNHAKCLRLLGEYEESKRFIDKAHASEPANAEVAEEKLKLEKERRRQKEEEQRLAKALIQ